MPDGSKDKSPRLKRDHGGWVLVAVAGIVLFSGSILAVIMRQYSGLLLLPGDVVLRICILVRLGNLSIAFFTNSFQS